MAEMYACLTYGSVNHKNCLYEMPALSLDPVLDLWQQVTTHLHANIQEKITGSFINWSIRAWIITYSGMWWEMFLLTCDT